MSVLSGVSNFFGLDIGVTAIRLVDLAGSGQVKSLNRYAYCPIDPSISMSDSSTDQQKLAQAIRNLLSESGVTTKNVAVGIPSSRVFTTVVDFDRLTQSELGKAIHLQAESIIPTPISESKLDWALIGDSPADASKVEVLISSVPNSYVESRLDMLEAIGLNVIAFEPDNLALARAILPAEVTSPQMVFDIGSRSTDIVVSMGGAPRLTRSIPTGSEAIIKAVTQSLGVDAKQAEQLVFKFGLGKDKLEGQIYQAIISTVDILTTEIDKSIKFINTRYPQAKVDRIIMTGGASALPEFPLYVANKFALNVEIGNSWRNISFPAERQNELLAVSNHFGVAAGLAERVE